MMPRLPLATPGRIDVRSVSPFCLLSEDLRHGQALQRGHQARCSRLEAGLDTVRAADGAEGRAERLDRSVRRHGARGVVAIRRSHQHADAPEACGQRPPILLSLIHISEPTRLLSISYA